MPLYCLISSARRVITSEMPHEKTRRLSRVLTGSSPRKPSLAGASFLIIKICCAPRISDRSYAGHSFTRPIYYLFTIRRLPIWGLIKNEIGGGGGNKTETAQMRSLPDICLVFYEKVEQNSLCLRKNFITMSLSRLHLFVLLFMDEVICLCHRALNSEI